MYEKRITQVSLDENPQSFIGVRLSAENRWVKLAEIIPWKEIEDRYCQTFRNPQVGSPAKPCRMAIGSLIIKERLKLSDEETVAIILDSPYMQYFIGMSEFSNKAPFDTSTMTYFRKRLTPEMLAEINDLIIAAGQYSEDEDNDSNGDMGLPKDQPNPELQNKGSLILDATCAPADIHFPTDVALLNDCRQELEELIDYLHAGSEEPKPRTYRQKARGLYLRFIRNKKPRKSQIRRGIREQLGFVRRDMKWVKELQGRRDRPLSERQQQYWETIQEVYRQQEEMYREKKHTIEDRIVSIHQPWVRPIVRGKVTAKVEFGAKISISMVNGYAMIEHLSWNACNEALDLEKAIENYKERYGFYPERILADKIYRNRKNYLHCKDLGIMMNGPRLGRPPKDKKLYSEQKRQEKSEAGERNAVEGKFGEAKRHYTLNRVMTRLKNTSEVSIHMTFLVMNLEKRLRDIHLLILYWLFSDPLAAV